LLYVSRIDETIKTSFFDEVYGIWKEDREEENCLEEETGRAGKTKTEITTFLCKEREREREREREKGERERENRERDNGEIDRERKERDRERGERERARERESGRGRRFIRDRRRAEIMGCW
jgi:ATP-dependent RNA helicase DDX46/PRP5